LIEIVQ